MAALARQRLLLHHFPRTTRPLFSMIQPIHQRNPTQARAAATTTSPTSTSSSTSVADPRTLPLSTTQPPTTSELLQRQPWPYRPLPTVPSLSATRQWLTTLPIFIAILALSAWGLFNYQKASSPLVTATLYALRTNDYVRQELGDEVYFATKWAWVRGSINLVRGKVDVWFKVKGKRERVGVCRFKAVRLGGKSGNFHTTEWSLTMEDTGEVIQLLDPEGKDPMAAY